MSLSLQHPHEIQINDGFVTILENLPLCCEITNFLFCFSMNSCFVFKEMWHLRNCRLSVASLTQSFQEHPFHLLQRESYWTFWSWTQYAFTSVVCRAAHWGDLAHLFIVHLSSLCTHHQPLFCLTRLFGPQACQENMQLASSTTSVFPTSAKGSSSSLLWGMALCLFMWMAEHWLLFLYLYQCSILVKIVFDTVWV